MPIQLPRPPPLSPVARASWRRARRWLRLRRAPVAGVLVAVAVASGLDALTPSRPPSVQVVVAGTDLSAGTRLGPADLHVVRLPPAAAPGGASSSPTALVGRVLAGAVRRGEPLTDARLVGAGLTDDLPPGAVAAPVRIADAAAAALLVPGQRVDVVGAPAAGAVLGDGATIPATPAGAVLARSALVVAVPAAATDPSAGDTGGTVGAGDGALVLLAVPRDTAVGLAAAATTDRLSVVLLPAQ